MNCPSCNSSGLLPKKLEYGLPAMSCSKCSGCQVELLSYRLWLESNNKRIDAGTVPTKSSDDTQRAISCPKCKSLMTKYRISAEVDNRLDLCASCGEIWLDGGEWQLLESLNLKQEMPSICSSPWQSQVRRQELRATLESSVIEQVGEADFKKAKEVRQWLNNHENSAVIKQIIFREDDI